MIVRQFSVSYTEPHTFRQTERHSPPGNPMLDRKPEPGVGDARTPNDVGSPSGGRTIRVSTDWAPFARYGLVIKHPGTSASRYDFSRVFETAIADVAPRLHVNRVEPSSSPLQIRSLERHPESWQTFLPLDVSRYLVCVAGSLPDGRPDLNELQAWVVDGDTGVAFAPGVWHAGATVLDGLGHFAVIWPRRDRDSDTEIYRLPEVVSIGE
jgi:ureidoglycolate lyase